MVSTLTLSAAADGSSVTSESSNADVTSNYGAGTVTSSVTYGNITFNNTFTSSANANASYKSAILSAEQTIRSLFTNTATLNLTFDAQAAGNTGFLASNTFNVLSESYSQIKTALASKAPGDTNLPSSDPANGGTWYLPQAYAIYLGLGSATSANEDTIPLNTSYAWSYGQDVIDTVIHEISEGGMGRIGDLNRNGFWSTMDLFRYSAANTHYYTFDATNT